MTYRIADAVLATEFKVVVPSITTWSRLEPQPTTADLAPALQAAVADPLWLVHRQWAFGELHGEDAGSPIDVRLAGDLAHVDRYRPGPAAGGAPSVDFDRRAVPLEVVVEREALRTDQPRIAAVAGQHAVRLLRAEGATAMVSRFVAEFPLTIAEPADPIADRRGAEWRAMLQGRGLDGFALADALDGHVDAAGEVTSLPAAPAIPQNQQVRVRRALSAWLAWWRGFVTEPDPSEASAWIAEREEYALSIGATASDGELVVRSDEYTDGRLDWWAFRLAGSPTLGSAAEPAVAERLVVPSMLPSVVRYPGMPADRFWEFEDARVNLGSLDAGPTDLGRLLLVEYGLVYGPDWWLVPLELPVGSLFRLTDMRVLDTFGIETTVRPSRNTSGPAWEAFELGVDGRDLRRLDDWFFLPPTLGTRLESDPIEEVSFLRDEMANLAWAVERRVAGVSGAPLERASEAARELRHQRVVGDVGDARLIYRLMTSVPTNWIPFEAVSAGAQGSDPWDVAFERRTLLRVHDDGSTEEVHPHGLLIRSDLSRPVETEPPLRIPDEEIGRDGAIVTRSMQYGRWLDGRSYVWMGRAKRTGRGEGASNLAYDRADPV
ncbi:MAG: hypothetical protein R2715_14765 [Ilumatobacteraceae bacterium]